MGHGRLISMSSTVYGAYAASLEALRALNHVKISVHVESKRVGEAECQPMKGCDMDRQMTPAAARSICTWIRYRSKCSSGDSDGTETSHEVEGLQHGMGSVILSPLIIIVHSIVGSIKPEHSHERIATALNCLRRVKQRTAASSAAPKPATLFVQSYILDYHS